MLLNENDECIRVAGLGYAAEVSRRDGRIKLTDLNKGLVVLETPTASYMPQLGDGENTLHNITVNVEHKSDVEAVLGIKAAPESSIADEVSGTLRFLPSAIEFQTGYVSKRPHRLGGWEVLPKGTVHTLHAVENLWNRPGSNENIWTYVLNVDAETTTGPANRLWAPHVPALVLNNRPMSMLIGALEITHAFGLTFKNVVTCHGSRFTCHCVLDFGGKEHGYPVEAGETVQSPLFVWKFHQSITAEDAYAEYFRDLEARHPDIVAKPRPELDIYDLPWYCTWGDQICSSYPANKGYRECLDALDEKLVLAAAEKIIAQKLNIKTIVIDDGWQKYKGDWEPDSTKFPDMRRLVDKLHGMGFRVILWWAPFWADDDAKIAQNAEMFCEGVNSYGMRVMDFSRKNVQEDYLKPLVRRFISPEPDCWGFDGLKIDYLADRYHASTHVEDRSWHGQEFFLLNLYRITHETAKGAKKDACMYTTAQNPFFSRYQDVNALEETFTPDVEFIRRRIPLTKKLLPHEKVTPHFNYYCNATIPYLEVCREAGYIPQIGILFKDLTGYEPGQEYFRILRKALEWWR